MTDRHTNRVAHAVQTLLDRESTFDPETRAYFWATHTEKVAAWQEAMAQALESAQFSGTALEFAILNQTVREMSIVSSVALTVHPEAARQNPDAIRSLVFSNVIAYFASAYDGRNELIDQWTAYVGTLGHIGFSTRSAICMACGSALPTTSKYCWNCGADQSSDKPVTHTRTTGSKVLRGAIWLVIGFVVGQFASAVALILLAGFIGPDTSPWHQFAALGVWIYVGYKGYQGTLSSRALNRSYQFVRANIVIVSAVVGLIIVVLVVSQLGDSDTSDSATDLPNSNLFNVPPTATANVGYFTFSQPAPTATARLFSGYASATKSIKYRVTGYGYPRGKVRISFVDSSGQYQVELGDVASSAWVRSVIMPRDSNVRLSVQPLVGSATCEIYVDGRMALSRVALRSTDGIAVCEL